MTLPDGNKAEDETRTHEATNHETINHEATDHEATDHEGSDGAVSHHEASRDGAPEDEASTSVALSDATGAAGTGAASIDPLLAKLADGGAKAADEGAEASAQRSIRGMLLDYSAHAAMIVGLIGFAWTVSDHVVARPTAAQIEAPPAPQPAKRADAGDPADMIKQADLLKQADLSRPAVASQQADAVAPKAAQREDVAELRAANQQLTNEVGALRAEIGTLHTALDRTPDQVRSLTAELDRTKADLRTAKSENASTIAQLSNKIDKLQHDPNSKMQQLVDKLAELEHKSVDASPTGSIAPSQAAGGKALPLPLPPAKPAPAKLATVTDDGHRPSADKATVDKPADGAQQKPQVLAGWVVREVYDGVALVEGRRGQIEVVPGVSIPGAGVVKSIDRHGNGWTVTTTKGLLASAAPQPRDYRRGNGRDAYPGYPYDF